MAGAQCKVSLLASLLAGLPPVGAAALQLTLLCKKARRLGAVASASSVWARRPAACTSASVHSRLCLLISLRQAQADLECAGSSRSTSAELQLVLLLRARPPLVFVAFASLVSTAASQAMAAKAAFGFLPSL